MSNGSLNEMWVRWASLLKVLVLATLVAVGVDIVTVIYSDVDISAASDLSGDTDPGRGQKIGPGVTVDDSVSQSAPVAAIAQASIAPHDPVLAPPAVPRIALHPLEPAQYRQYHADGAVMSELITSLLMIELGKSNDIELMERSLVPAIFKEKSQLLVNDRTAPGLAAFAKVPLSDFTLTGSLSSSPQGKSYTLKLVRNATGQIWGARRFFFDMETLPQAIEQAARFVHEVAAQAEPADADSQEIKVAFGHFVSVDGRSSELTQGRDITDALIRDFVNRTDYTIFARTQAFPLLFEEYLRMLQYSDESRTSARTNVDYLVYGKYKTDFLDVDNPITIYLYIDRVRYGRDLVIVHAADWQQAEKSIVDVVSAHLPKRPGSVAKDEAERSRKLFGAAVRARGLSFSQRLLDGDAAPSQGDILAFKSDHHAENVQPAQDLLQQSLQVDPGNQFARLALALILERQGSAEEARRLVEDVRNTPGPGAEMAFEILAAGQRKFLGGLKPEVFSGVVASGREAQALQALIDEGYLREQFAKVMFDDSGHLDAILNYSHTSKLSGFSIDDSIRIFERMRALIHYQGLQVEYIHPSSYDPARANRQMRGWRQVGKKSEYNAEAVLHFDVASHVSGLHAITFTDMPSVEFYPEMDGDSIERRLANLEVAVDGYAASAYLDASYLEATVLLGYALCQEQIGRCASGNMVHAWVIDHAKKANLRGRDGTYHNVTSKVEERDRLIFLSADAIDRVADADLTDMFRDTLLDNEYRVSKSGWRLERTLRETGEPTSDRDFARLVHAYAELIEAQCGQLAQRPRGLESKLREYLFAMEALAKLASRNERAAQLRAGLLHDIESRYPTVYPYLIVAMRPVAPFVEKEQDDMIARVSARSVKSGPVDLMESAMNLFEAAANSKDEERARRYIGFVADYYGLDANTAIDIAYMYQCIGDTDKAAHLLKAYGKNGFVLSAFSDETINGTYQSGGFDAGGRLIYGSADNPSLRFVYDATRSRSHFGEGNLKWTLLSARGGMVRTYAGNDNQEHIGAFAFGNGGQLFGKMTWTVQADEPVANVAEHVASTSAASGSAAMVTTELIAMEKAELALPENSVERLLGNEFAIDHRHDLAIKGFSGESAEGPLRDEYFPPFLADTRRVGVVREQLFNKGYLSVTGFARFDQETVHDRLAADFPDFSKEELFGLQKTLEATRKLAGAGYAQLYEARDGVWEKTAALVPEDAIADRRFGLAVAVYDGQSLICDEKDGLYHFKRVADQWQQQSRLVSRCDTLGMNDQWAVVGSGRKERKVLVYRNDGGGWQAVQTLAPDVGVGNGGMGRSFEYFGKAVAVTKDTIAVGVPYGANGNNGQVYIYSLAGDHWKLTQTLESGPAFGSSLAATDELLLVGDPGEGETDSSAGSEKSPTWLSGAVSVYQRTAAGWLGRAKLLPKGRPRQEQFGSDVAFKEGGGLQVLVKSRTGVYRVPYADVVANGR